MSEELNTFLKNIKIIGKFILELKEIKQDKRDDEISSFLLESSHKNEIYTHSLLELFLQFRNRNNSNNFFTKYDNDFLLISRFFRADWEEYIKDYIRYEIKNGSLLQDVKNLLVGLFREYYMKTGLNFTWDLYTDIRTRLFKYTWPLHNATDEIFNISTHNISDDISWINNITIEQLTIPKKIKLHKNCTKKDFVNALTNSINRKVSKEDVKSIREFVYNILSYKDETIELNRKIKLDFINKKENNKLVSEDVVSFFKIFFYAQKDGLLIVNKQKDLIISLSYVLSELLPFTFSTIKKGFEGITKKEVESDTEFEISAYDDYLLIPFYDASGKKKPIKKLISSKK